MNIYEEIEKYKIVPVVVLKDAQNAVDLAKALIAGGLPVAEVTFRTEAAEEAIRTIVKELPDMLVGAGTITTAEQAKRALDAGARFLVTPGFSRSVTEFAVKQSCPIFPGVCTPTELMMAQEYHLSVVKFFPAAQYGGLNTIKALSGPFPQIRFMPTGGINAGNIKEYLGNPKIIACGGSWMVKDSLIQEGRFDEIERLTAEAVSLINEN
ncbi:bifunctional 4-hydroxy-2-oxoglutarate aldolase/2-dehydro-3-deoxy-phosphogluconate aldolase [Candidatus Merdisoma sp. JLR.KK006]|uniref:bifunctional 4-hydroxy-2-oxoglutarate aldolase/2-dehydro-3-deoxy-phosphogluconate aldolase n=1 Tax=Candidatus Merdisoma sp. JLR.KK006 TaxID=3112626 RepID=UPI002FF28148